MILTRRTVYSSVIIRSALRCFSSTEKEFLVVNAVGVDRPGIVSDLTKMVVNSGGNVGESQAAKLGSHFGLMMLISVPKLQSEVLQNALSSMEGMSTSCYLTGDPDAVEVTPHIGYSGRFQLSGADHPGIVHRVTAILAKHRLNIDKLATSEESAPYGGTTLFQMECIATSPAPLAKSFDAEVIREELEEFGDQMNCDITLEDVYDEKISSSFYV